MEAFLRRKKEAKRLVDMNGELPRYAYIYDNCQKDVCNIYMNIYKKCKEGVAAKGEDVFGDNPREMEETVKRFVEEKNINDDGRDKSIKKSIDLLISPCIYEINRSPNYFTSSCCSGRIVVFGEASEEDQEGEVGQGGDVKDTANGRTKRTFEEDAFVSYLKRSYHGGLPADPPVRGCYSDHQSDSTVQERSAPPEKTKRKHRKNVKIYYSSHMHQNLREASKLVKRILTECLGGATTPPPVSTEREENSGGVATQWSAPSRRRKKVARRNNPGEALIWTDDEDLTIVTPKKTTRIFFKFEPFIIHVKCVNLESALRLLKMGQMAGLKQSGLLNFNRYVTVAIRGSMRLEHYVEDPLSLEEDSIAKLLHVCNGKMDHNLRQLVGFYHCYRESTLGGDSKWHPLQLYQVQCPQCLKCEKRSQCAQVCPCDGDQRVRLPLQGTIKKDLPWSGQSEGKGSPTTLPNTQWEKNPAMKEKKKKKEEKEKGEINLKKYNMELSSEGHIGTGTSPMGGDSSLQWKLLSSEGDLDKFFVWGHDMFIEEGKIYLFGGFAKGVRSRELKIFDVRRKSLKTYQTPLPSLSYHCFFRLDRNYACVFGGRRSPECCTSDVWLYDVRRNTWCAAEWRSNGEKTREDGRGDERGDGEDSFRPCGRYRHACVFVRRYRKKQKEVYLFYVHGGVTEKNEVLNDLWEGKLTVQGDMSMRATPLIKWERKHRLEEAKQEGESPSPFVKNHTMVYNKRRNLIHIVGGCSSSCAEGAPSSHPREEDYMDHLHTYDLKRDCFFYLRCGTSGEDGQASFPLNRFSHGTCAWGHNDFVLMGGLNMHRTLNDVWLFRMKERKWYRLGVFPFHSMYVRAKIVNEGDYLYVVGGGCTVFTFGSFFDVPVVANCRKVLVEKGVEKGLETGVYKGMEKPVCQWENRAIENPADTRVENGAKNQGDNLLDEEAGGAPDLAKSYLYLEKSEKRPQRKSHRSVRHSRMATSPGKKPPGELLYLIAKNRTYVKEVKTALEQIGAFDKGRKIEVYKEGTSGGNDQDSFFVPVLAKIETLKNYEQVRRFFPFEKIQFTKEGQIFYIHRSPQGGEEKTNLKRCLTNLFYNFANEKVKKYLSESERKLIVRASGKYEVVGGIVIFHYKHLGSILRLYRTCVWGSASKCTEMQTGRYARLRALLRKCKHRELISSVDALWLDVRDAFNRFRFRGGHRGRVARRQPRLRLRYIGTFLKFSSLARRRTVLRGLSVSARWGRKSPLGGREKSHCSREKKAGLLNHPWCSPPYRGRRAVKLYQLAKMKKQLKELHYSKYGIRTNPRGKRIKAIAVYEQIEGVKRKNKIHLVLGRNTKTVHIENNVVYKLDLQKCMFCSGNGTEKERIKNLYLDPSNMVVSKENVVDLFCGAGYFTLPLLKFVGEGKIKEYYACDINGDSLRLLRDAVKMNGIETTQLHILRQNSFVVTKNAQLVRRCHRVFLGLLPHSVEAWCNAFQLLDDNVGGTLHIHGVGENVFEEQFFSRVSTYDYVSSVKGVSQTAVTDLSLTELVRRGLHVADKLQSEAFPSIGKSCPRGEVVTSGDGDKFGKKAKSPYRGNKVPESLHFAQFVLLEIFKLTLKDYLEHKTNWVISILHVERVKSYAPRVYHYVVDVRCMPQGRGGGEV
ncbi:hypothetical protein C922_04660 [Plasmodium inui San Antonio 1]|uniref:tRNA(Phe) 7-[(3-amino-3-carboxypropyl)-4-demethylwyosine(37)-N(4)]-methyltransferase n=1 Tax=Plasmodium inui San Antonio 1 TaxID=1237626 RepID=W7A061_9APIC|nr:hypothetical protein C922_04660 [Plasmodium inui San Antonio 1]EUD64928.1 hypothetical protein C922_04660 [Plasmodium inui San Antonio 1]